MREHLASSPAKRTSAQAAICDVTCVTTNSAGSAPRAGSNALGRIPNRRGIAKRPPSVERKSDYCLLAQAPHKTSETVSASIIRLVEPIKVRVSTLTFDNGLEFAQHADIDQALGLGSTSLLRRPVRFLVAWHP